MSKRKFTRDQARTALLSAGREMLGEVGLSGGVGRVSLAEAISRSGVPRPSAYRVFGESDLEPQRAFHEELIIDLTTTGPKLDLQALTDPVAKLLEQVDQIGVEATPAELTSYLAELIRRASDVTFDEAFSDTPVGVYLSVLASTLDDARNERIERAIRAAEEATVSALIPFLREALTAFGLRLRAGWTYLDLSSAVVSAILGSVLTARVSPAPQKIELATGLDGTVQPWTPLGVTLLGITGMATEPDPRMVTSALPSRWFG